MKIGCIFYFVPVAPLYIYYWFVWTIKVLILILVNFDIILNSNYYELFRLDLGSSPRGWLVLGACFPAKWSHPQACQNSRSLWTMLSGRWCDSWGVMCRPRSFTLMILVVPSNSGYSWFYHSYLYDDHLLPLRINSFPPWLWHIK